eukprot:COSAG01_NODE_4107_length_5341_cov_235.805990_3_plen_389_part_00
MAQAGRRAAGGGGGAVVPPALLPSTPDEFDASWTGVEELELQDVLQCIGDDLSGAGGCLTQAEWPVGGKANFLQQERLVAKMRSVGIHVSDFLPVDESFKRKDRAWWKAIGVPLLTRVRAKLGASAAGSGKVSAGMFDGHILRREESDKVVVCSAARRRPPLPLPLLPPPPPLPLCLQAGRTLRRCCHRRLRARSPLRSPLGGTGLFSRKHLPAGYEIDYYGEYFASIDELIEAGQDESQYVIGERKRNGDYRVVVNGKSVPKQFAIYANHQPNRKANARLVWDKDRYLDGGEHGQSTRGQHALQLKHPIGPGVEITVDYGPTYGYDVQGFSRSGYSTAAYTTDSGNSRRGGISFATTTPTHVRNRPISDEFNYRRYPYKAHLASKKW